MGYRYVGRLPDDFIHVLKNMSSHLNIEMINPNFPNILITARGTINQIMGILFVTKEAGCMIALEKFYTYLETKRNDQINDKCTAKENCSFYTVM
jgi:hypothetical protein